MPTPRKRLVGRDGSLAGVVSIVAGQRRAILERAAALRRARRFEEAEALCRAHLAADAGAVDVWLLVARLRQDRGDLAGMRLAAERAQACDPGHAFARLLQAEADILDGRAGSAAPILAALECDVASDPQALQRIGEAYTQFGASIQAYRCYRRARDLMPGDPRALYNLSTAALAIGRLGEAEDALDTALALAPDDYDAWYNRATLRKQTPARNHVASIEAMLARPLRHPGGETALCYALAKELEDLGDDAGALAALQRGAARRRSLLAYRVEDDVATMRDIAAAFDAGLLAGVEAELAPEGPVFVLGLPRSGTTLVDRILSSHSAVASLGEVNDLALAVVRGAGQAADKGEVVRRAAAADPAAIGADYRARTRAYGVEAPYLIDKTPLNFLYIGLIARALPSARIVHLSRHPMDSCFAMFKTLFRMGYPFSYDFGDLAAYYAAYRRLMEYWRRVLPGRLVEVRYEDLVENHEGETRRLVAACGLDWQDACLDFHQNQAPVSTASAVQVRRPIYREAVGRWRRLGASLDPLRAALAKAGVPEDALA